jgi:hypothetical protein
VFARLGAWLKESAYSSLCDQDRAALISIGKALDLHEAAIGKFLAATTLFSPQSIWAEIEDELDLVPADADEDAADADEDAASDADDAADRSSESEGRQAASKGGRPAAAAAGQADQHADDHQALDDQQDAGERQDPWDEHYDLVLITPTAKDVQLLQQGTTKRLERDLPLGQLIDPDGPKPVVVIDTTVRDLPVIHEKLPALLGLQSLDRARVLMVEQPSCPDVTGARVLVACWYGEAAVPDDWPTTLDPVEIVETLHRGFSSAVRVLGDEPERDGWSHCDWRNKAKKKSKKAKKA